jgi:hypothetical protein
MNDVRMAVFSCYCWPFVGRLSGPTTRGEMVVVSIFFILVLQQQYWRVSPDRFRRISP